jgi:hypothetical protein
METEGRHGFEIKGCCGRNCKSVDEACLMELIVEHW